MFCGGSKSAKGDPIPLADMDRGSPNPLADLDRGSKSAGGSKSAVTPAVRYFYKSNIPGSAIVNVVVQMSDGSLESPRPLLVGC